MAQQQMSLAGMGGPVGGTPNNSLDNQAVYLKKLNTAIYDYLLRNRLYDIARMFNEQMPIETKTDIKTDIKESPNQRSGQQVNGIEDDADDNKDQAILKRPEGLPLPNNLFDGPVLQDWWCQFWEIWHGHRGNGKIGTQKYIGAQRQAQKGRFNLMGGMNPNAVQYNSGMPNMANGVGGGPGDLRKTVMNQNARNMTPQQIQQMQQLKNMQNQQHNAQMMERQNSNLEMGGPRSGSPGSGDAPSPKRQRLDVNGNMQQMNQGRHGQQGQMMPGGQGMTPNMDPNGAQGSPLAQSGMDNGDPYAGVNGRLAMNQNGAAAVAANQNGQSSGHALQDYQMQLMLLEQQNKKRLLMARQEQDNVGGHTGSAMPSGQFAQGMMDPNSIPPNIRANMVSGPNGQMMAKGPSSHPMTNLTPQQMEMMRQQHELPSAQQIQSAQAQMMANQQGQGQPLGTPRPQNTNMPPPPAPQHNAGGTGPSSPAPQAAPPTPSQAAKAKPGAKKDGPAKKGAANKKGANAAATAASEAEPPPTPTPATPATPVNSFAHKQNQQLPNGQSAQHAAANMQANAPQQHPQQHPQAQNNQAQPQVPQQQQQLNGAPNQSVQQPPNAAPTLNDGPFGAGTLGMPMNDDYPLQMDFGGTSVDDLDSFDFDSFLTSDETFGMDNMVGLDANFAFDGEMGALEGN